MKHVFHVALMMALLFGRIAIDKNTERGWELKHMIYLALTFAINVIHILTATECLKILFFIVLMKE